MTYVRVYTMPGAVRAGRAASRAVRIRSTILGCAWPTGVGTLGRRSRALQLTTSSTRTDGLRETGAAPGARRRRAVRAGRTFALFCILALLAAIGVLSVLSGGYILQRTAPVILAFAALAIVGVWRARHLDRPPRAYLIALAAFAAFVAWAGLSVLWSTGPDLSWVAFDVAALYLAVMAALGLLPGGPRQLRLAAHGFALLVVLIAAWAFLGKVVPDVVTHAHIFARLRAPIGYWNVLAGMIVMAVPVFLVTASRKGVSPLARGLAASVLVLLLLTFFFTFSRGGFVALAVELLIFFALTTRRLSAFLSLVIPVAVTAAVLVGLRGLGTLFAPTTDDALRVSHGHTLAIWSLVALAVALGAQAGVALAERRWPLPERYVRPVGRAVVVVLVGATLVFGVAYVVGHGGADGVATVYHEALSSSGPANDAQRLTSLGTSGRLPWYREALRAFVHHPVAGTGAGTFRLTDDLYRANTYIVKHSHSQWLNVLSELGMVGFILFMTVIGGLVVAVFRRPLRDGGDPDQALLAACQAAVVAFLLRISIDWDWDMAAITLAFLLLAGVSAAYVAERRARGVGGRTPEPGSRRAVLGARRVLVPSSGVRVFVTCVIVLGALSWALPFLSERATVSSQMQLSLGQVTAAADSARHAAAFDPLAVDPLLALAAAQVGAGDPQAAADTLERAVRLQPDNYEPYYEMGNLQLRAFGDAAAARLWYEKALQLNSMNVPTQRALQGL